MINVPGGTADLRDDGASATGAVAAPLPYAPVVVGVSDTSSAHAAVARGVDEARSRGRSLHLVRVWEDIDRLFSMTRTEVAHLGASEQENKMILERAAWEAGQIDDQLEVTTELVPGNLLEAMTEQSFSATLLVLGADVNLEEQDFAAWLAQRVRCPVVVVDAPEPATP
jgi:hypothetical protein